MRVVLRPILALLCLVLARDFDAIAADSSKPDVLMGKGYGLDHVVVVVSDLEAARGIFGEQLGFKLPPRGVAGHHPSGTMNASTYFANLSYLELLAVEDRDKVARNNPAILALAGGPGGAHSFALSTSAAEQTAAKLKELRVAATGPATGTITRPGDTAPPKPKWLTVDLARSETAPLFFIQYLDTDYNDIFSHWEEGFAEAKSAPYYQQPNTATGLSAVWVAVRDLEAASKVYATLLGPAYRDSHSSTLAAKVRSFKVVRQQVLLLQADDATGPVGRFVTERGPGIMGISVEVRDFAAARAVTRSLPPPGAMRKEGLVSADSLLVPGELAQGLWIEFHASAP